jgi:Ca-activated chloride channel family protein
VKPRLVRFSCLPFLLLAAAGAQDAPRPDPLLWPEPQRAFFQDGPGLLLGPQQRSAFLAADEAGREGIIAGFMTPEVRQAIERRRQLANLEVHSPTDVRWKLLFLNGKPAERKVVDCGIAFKPLEVWTYRGSVPGGEARPRYVVLYRAVGDEPFRMWESTDSKRILYSSEMEYWLEQWEEARGAFYGRRFDHQVCKEAELVDRATGVNGLTGSRKGLDTQGRRIYGLRPGGAAGETFLDPPSQLALWVRDVLAAPPLPAATAATAAAPAGKAAAGKAAAPPALAVPGFDVEFPERVGGRMLVRGVVQAMAGRMKDEVKSDASAGAAPATPATTAPAAAAPGGTPVAAAGPGSTPATAAPARPIASLTVEGLIEAEGRVFESFRLRYRVPWLGNGVPVALAVDRQLRPGRSFVMRLIVKDDATGAEARVARGFAVPAEPRRPAVAVIAPAAPEGPAGAGDAGAAAQQLRSSVRDSLTLVPPEDDVILGLWRTQALVTGARIVKVNFLVDGKAQLTRSTPPYTAEIRLARYPVEQVVRAEGFDASGQLVASDEVVLNEPRGGLKVSVLEPPRGAKVSADKVKARAEVTVPQERRVQAVEFRVNDVLQATLTKPPWETSVAVPKGADTVYLTVSAQLDDGSRSEDVRFLRSPEYVEQVEVNLVELYTAVVDGAGHPVQGLSAGDFSVLEGGKAQKLSRFEPVESLPLTLGILIDTSGSMSTSLPDARRAAGGFLERLVRRGDRCFTVTFSDHPVLHMPLTDDARAAAQSLDNLQAVGATSIHDAVVHSLYYFRGTRGQRALVLLSDGDDNSSELTFDETLEYAKRSGVSIYVIGLDISKLSVGIRGKLNKLTEISGGRVFYVSRGADLVPIYAEIERELRSRYLLAFESGVSAGEGGYRPVEVKVLKPGLKARTARGYYP